MKPALVILDHGSRRDDAHAHLEKIAARVREQRPDCLVYIAHLELRPPSLAEAIDASVRDGASAITVHPFFLLPGRHQGEDVPALVREARARHPGLDIRISPYLGEDPGLADLILRVCEID